MARSLNDLTEREFAGLSTVISLHISTNAIAMLRLADTYKLDKNELFDYWLFNEEKFIKSTDFNKRKGLTVEQGMKLLKAFLKPKERNNETNTN